MHEQLALFPSTKRWKISWWLFMQRERRLDISNSGQSGQGGCERAGSEINSGVRWEWRFTAGLLICNICPAPIEIYHGRSAKKRSAAASSPMWQDKSLLLNHNQLLKCTMRTRQFKLFAGEAPQLFQLELWSPVWQE